MFDIMLIYAYYTGKPGAMIEHFDLEWGAGKNILALLKDLTNKLVGFQDGLMEYIFGQKNFDTSEK